jgi:hypothetical protein
LKKKNEGKGKGNEISRFSFGLAWAPRRCSGQSGRAFGGRLGLKARLFFNSNGKDGGLADGLNPTLRDKTAKDGAPGSFGLVGSGTQMVMDEYPEMRPTRKPRRSAALSGMDAAAS